MVYSAVLMNILVNTFESALKSKTIIISFNSKSIDHWMQPTVRIPLAQWTCTTQRLTLQA